MNAIAFNLIYYTVTGYSNTWRYDIKRSDKYMEYKKQGKPIIHAIWHDQMLPLLLSARNEGNVTLTSNSKDGELIAKSLTRWGYHVARGSSSRGGVKALIEMKKLINKHKNGALTVDGPRGPRHVIKPGIVYLAKKLDCVIAPVIMDCRWYKRFNSWDKFLLPYPFAKVHVRYTDPIEFSPEVDDESVEKDRLVLEKIMLERTGEYTPHFL